MHRTEQLTAPRHPRAPFGRVVTAMVTPFTDSGKLDVDLGQELASRLVDDGNDALVVNGTTGESATTSDSEKDELLRAVVDAVGDRAQVVAGVITNDTRHAIELSSSAAAAGASGLLLVTPYFNQPCQAGIVAHVEDVLATCALPVMLYDIPGRAGVALETETILRLAEKPGVVALKDAKLDLAAAAQVMGRSDLAYYSGHDAWTLPLLAIGAAGVVGTSTHFTAGRTRELIAAFEAGDVRRARDLHVALLPLYAGIFRTQGPVLVKAGLRLLGRAVGPVRRPLREASQADLEQLQADLDAAARVPAAAP